MDTSRPQPCTRHPGALSGWRCQSCESWLCPECLQVGRMQTVDLFSCRACGGEAAPLLVHRSEAIPLHLRLREAWHYPISQPNLLMAVGCSALLGLLGFMTDLAFPLMKLLPAMIRSGIFWAVFFLIIRSTSRGETEIPTPDASDLFTTIYLPAIRGLVATTVIWAPALTYAIVFRGWNVFAQLDGLLLDPMFYVAHKMPTFPESQLLSDPLFWLIALAGFLALPMVLILAASNASLLEVLHPVKVVHFIRRIGRDYMHTLAALALLAVLLLGVRLLGSGLRALDIFIFSRWLSELLECIVLFGMAHVHGLLLHTRGDELGYGHPTDYLVPVLPPPRTTLRPDLEKPLGPGALQPGASRPNPQLAELTAAVEAGDKAKALALYTELSLPMSAIAPALHLFVGQAAASRGDFTLSVRALEAAADAAPDDPTAPRALVLLARVLGERMQETARAQDVYRYIVQRYPDTDASRFARARLPPTT